jgi:GTP-binding protein YchF
MDIAIIGLPQSGKTTVFNALTHSQASTTGAGSSAAEMHIGVVKVPDPRLDTLAKMFHPQKIVSAEIKYWDLPGPDFTTRSQGISGKHRNILQGADAFLLVVRAFTNPAVVHPMGSVNPRRDLEAVLSELTFADLEVLERAVERLEDNIKKSKPPDRPGLARHLEAVQKVKQGLEEDVPLRRQQLTDSETSFLVNYQLLTAKPVIVAFSTDEPSPGLSLGQLELAPELTTGLGEVSLSAKLEAELALMSDEEAAEFREDLGLGESALSQVIRVSYQTVGLVSFLTIGEDEVRAWSVPEGLPAQEAAGAIHSDFYRGFIRAEVIPYPDLARCGSLAQGRKEGVLRSEGKTYPVKDGDVIHFLVNV